MKRRERNYIKMKQNMQRKGTDKAIKYLWCLKYKDIFDNWENPLTKRKLKKNKKYVDRNY